MTAQVLPLSAHVKPFNRQRNTIYILELVRKHVLTAGTIVYTGPKAFSHGCFFALVFHSILISTDTIPISKHQHVHRRKNGHFSICLPYNKAFKISITHVSFLRYTSVNIDKRTNNVADNIEQTKSLWGVEVILPTVLTYLKQWGTFWLGHSYAVIPFEGSGGYW